MKILQKKNENLDLGLREVNRELWSKLMLTKIH